MTRAQLIVGFYLSASIPVFLVLGLREWDRSRGTGDRLTRFLQVFDSLSLYAVIWALGFTALILWIL